MLRQVRPRLIELYCRSRGLELGIDVASLGKDSVDVLANVMVAMPPEHQTVIDIDFARIAHLACRTGSTVLVQVAGERTSTLADEMATCRTHQERAMYVFIKQRTLFAEAEARMLMDGASQGRWKRSYVEPKILPQTSHDGLTEFDYMIRGYYAREFAGRHNHIDVYVRRDPVRFCYFVYPEDQSRGELAYTDAGELILRTRRSAMELVFVYQPATGIIEVLAPGGREVVEDLVAIFAETVLGLKDPPALSNKPPFRLDLLKHRSFEFSVRPEDGIRSIFITELCVGLVDARGNQIVYRARANDFRPKEVYSTLERTLNQRQLTHDDIIVKGASLRVVFEPVNQERPRVVAFKLTAPEGSTLKDDPHDQVIKDMLQRSGIAVNPASSGHAA